MKNKIERLKLLRKASGLTYVELAEKSGLSLSTVSQYCIGNGRREYIYDILINNCKDQIVKNCALLESE